jgi:hypothetical protein
MTKNKWIRALLLTSSLSLLAIIGCRHLPGGTDGGAVSKIVDCAQKSIRDKGLLYVGKVNSIIGATDISDRDARSRLIDLGIDAGQDILGCLLRDQGVKFAESADANPADQMSVTAARRAKTRLGELEAEGWRFQ